MKDLVDMTWKESKEIDKKKAVVFVTIAPIEEHGLCLPIENTNENITSKLVQEENKMIGNRIEEAYKGLCVIHRDGFQSLWKAHWYIEKYAQEKEILLDDVVIEVYNRDMSVEVFYKIKE